MTFVDVGADIGFFSILAAARVVPGRVFAYESELSRVALLRQNIAMNHFEDYVRVIAKNAGRDRESIASSEQLDAELRGVPFVDLVRLDVTSDAATVIDGMTELLAQQRIGAIATVYDASLLPEERWEATGKALTGLVKRRDATLHIPGNSRVIPLDEAHTTFRYPHLLVRFPGASISP
jgi:tRNA G37 N-methylase Trm5